jgi:hypothetical protein
MLQVICPKAFQVNETLHEMYRRIALDGRLTGNPLCAIPLDGFFQELPQTPSSEAKEG